jgi:hypothetical protein
MRCAIALSAATLLGFMAHADAPAAAAAAAAAAAESAVWTPKEVNFTYQGFTARYSCDGLAAKVKKVLLRLGARKDLQVSPSGCSSGFGRPSPFPGVRIRMNVLTPADATAQNSAVPTVPAVWKRVDVVGKGDPVRRAFCRSSRPATSITAPPACRTSCRSAAPASLPRC